MIVRGKAMKVGDNVDTDVVLPGKYLVLTDPVELGKHAMEGLDPAFAEKAKKGVILVGGKNFGCGSSREQAPIALKSAGVRCVVAGFFARIFYRNAINIGLPIVESGEASTQTREGDLLVIDLSEGTVENASLSKTWNVQPLPDFLQEILEDGGLAKHTLRMKTAGRER